MTEESVYRGYLERKNDREKQKSSSSTTSRPHIRSKLSRYRRSNVLYKSSQIIWILALLVITILTLGIMFFVPSGSLLSPHSVDVEGIFPIPGHLHGLVVPHNRELDDVQFLSPYFDEEGDFNGPDPELEMVTEIKPIEELVKEVEEIEKQTIPGSKTEAYIEQTTQKPVVDERFSEIVQNGAQEYHQIQNFQNKFEQEPSIQETTTTTVTVENSISEKSDSHEDYIAHFGAAPITHKPKTTMGLRTSTTPEPETSAYFQDIAGPQYSLVKTKLFDTKPKLLFSIILFHLIVYVFNGGQNVKEFLQNDLSVKTPEEIKYENDLRSNLYNPFDPEMYTTGGICPYSEPEQSWRDVEPELNIRRTHYLLNLSPFGPNNQFRGFRDTIILAYYLNRTIVLPPFFKHKSDPSHKLYFQYKNVENATHKIDVLELAKWIPVITE